MPNKFFDRLKAPERKPPTQADEIANGIIKVIALLALAAFLIYAATYYF